MSASALLPPSPAAARDRLVDTVRDFDSAVAVAAILLRLGPLPPTLKARLDRLGLREQVAAHMSRLHRERDFDQAYAVERLQGMLAEGRNVIALSGAAGTGKSHTTIVLEETLRRRQVSVAAVGPTNMAVNVLMQRGLVAKTIHAALYELGFGPAGQAVTAWLAAGGEGELPDTVSSRLRIMWRQVSAGPRERAAKFAQNSLPGRALRELGFAGGFMDVLPPLWDLKALPEADKVQVVLVDEASMVTSTMLTDLQTIGRQVILIGDLFQLPPVIEQNEAARGVTGAMAQVPTTHQVHLYTDRRTAGGTQHLRAAGDILRDDVGLADLDRWAREATLPGLSHARAFDAEGMAQAPALGYYRNTVNRLSVSWRQRAGLPDDTLVPGERLIIESVARDQRDVLTPLGIVKNARVIVLEQTSPYQVRLIGEGVLGGLALTAKQTATPLTREVVFAAGAVVALGVSYPVDELRSAGVALSETVISRGRLAPAQGHAVAARFAAASTTHKAQGSSYPIIQIAADDFYGYARSAYGGAIEADVPVPTWRRVVYTALTRAERGVIWIREGHGYRSVGAKFVGESSAEALELTLPRCLRGLAARTQVSELDAALGTVETDNVSLTLSSAVRLPAEPVTPLFRPSAGGSVWSEPASPEPPLLPLSLLAWLSGLGEWLPRQLPAGTAAGDMFAFRLRYPGEIEVTLYDAAANQRRSGVFNVTDPSMRPGNRTHGTLGHADIDLLTARLDRLRQGDPSVFVGLAQCGICGRELTNPVSRRFGVGPVCAAKYNIATNASGE